MCSWIRKCNINKNHSSQSYPVIKCLSCHGCNSTFWKTTTKPHQRYLQNAHGPSRDSTLPKILEVAGLKFPEFKTYDKATVIKTKWILASKQTGRPREQKRPQKQTLMSMSKDLQKWSWHHVWRKGQPRHMTMETLYTHMLTKKVDPYPLYIRINSKWIKGLALWHRPATSGTQETQAGGWHI